MRGETGGAGDPHGAAHGVGDVGVDDGRVDDAELDDSAVEDAAVDDAAVDDSAVDDAELEMAGSAIDDAGADWGDGALAEGQLPDMASGALRSARHMITGVDPGNSEFRGRAPSVLRRRGRGRYRSNRDATYSGARADDRDPAPIGSVVKKSADELGWTVPLAQARVLGEWAAIVGPAIALRSQPVSLNGTELRVMAETTAWAVQLRLMTPQILAKISADLPPGIVTKIIFTGPTSIGWRRGPWSMSGGRGVRDTYG